MVDFVPCPPGMVPPVVRDEFRQVFDDLDEDCCGLLRPTQVTAALALNRVTLNEEEAAALIRAMDPTASGWVALEPFTCALYALSLVQREVCEPRVYSVFPDSDFTAQSATGILRLRRAVWLALEDPSSSRQAFWAATVVVAVIAVSTIGIVVETFPDARAAAPAAFDGLEVFCAVFFSAELLLRAVTTPYLTTFPFQTRTIIDVLAVLPFYVTLIAAAPGSGGGSAGAALRVVRVLRVVRLFKLGRYVTWMNIFARTLAASLPALGSGWLTGGVGMCGAFSPLRVDQPPALPSSALRPVLLFIATLVAIVSASATYFAERGEWDSEAGQWLRPDGSRSPFQSIPETMWFTVVTMTTVGYGDVFPVTVAGSIVAAVSFMCAGEGGGGGGGKGGAAPEASRSCRPQHRHPAPRDPDLRDFRRLPLRVRPRGEPTEAAARPRLAGEGGGESGEAESIPAHAPVAAELCSPRPPR